MRGPAGEHTIDLTVVDGEITEGIATWAPPRQNARANVEFPRIELTYRIDDFETGQRSPLAYIRVTHAVRPPQTRARTAEITFGAYQGEAPERREWNAFAMARNPENTGWRNSDAIAGSVAFNSRTALELAQTAAQIETLVITDEGEQMADGTFSMVHRPAMNALFDHVFGQARQAAGNWRRECRALRYDETR